MFELTKEQFVNLRSHIGTSSWGGQRYYPMVFIEQGISILSSVLKSPRAIAVNIEIIRVFTKLRAVFSETTNLKMEMEEIN